MKKVMAALMLTVLTTTAAFAQESVTHEQEEVNRTK